jgi:hypothetical protein
MEFAMKKKLMWIGIALVALFLAAQVYQPERINPPVDDTKTIFASLEVPPDVKSVLDRSCADCHSHNTVWPWYSHIAPTSWLTARDVKNGRKSMNFSTWGTYKKTKQVGKLDDISEQLTGDKMPLKPYRIMHPGSILSKSEVDLVVHWAEKERDRLSEPDTTEHAAKK